MKTVLLVPGFPHSIDSLNYRAVIEATMARGYRVQFVPIRWRGTVIDDWVRELMRTYEKYNPADTILAGFSFGAVTTFVVAANRPPAELWLFSLSPTFDDDRELTKPDKATLRTVGIRRLRAFGALNYPKLAKNITCKTLVFYGEQEAKELPELARRCQLTSQDIPNGQLIKAASARHDVGSADYIAAIRSNI